jgi:hypothetical protein
VFGSESRDIAERGPYEGQHCTAVMVGGKMADVVEAC